MKVFFDKVASKLDRMDAESVRRQYKSLVRDIEFFESIFRALREGVIVAGPGRMLLYANESAGALARFDPGKSRGRPLDQILPDWDWEGILGDGDAVRQGVSVREIEIAYPERRIVEIQSVPSASGTVAILRDVTALHEKEADALEFGRTEAIKELAAGVAHEIGNPLNALSMNLDMLARELRGVEDAELRERLLADVDVAKSEARRIDGINREFLSAMRPVRPDFAPGSVAEPLRDTLAELKRQIEDRRIHVELDLPPALPRVMLDAAQMRQVFFNLVKNALEAMKDGGTLTIELSSDDHSVTASFRDTGSGISADAMARIFDAYRTTKPRGNGLGLMICRRIVRAHGGSMDVESKEGEGAKFVVRLPRMEKRVRRLT